MSVRPWWDSLLNRVFSRGVELPLTGGVDFLAPLRASYNSATQRTEVTADAGEVADGSVTEAKLADGSVTEAKLAAAVVTEAKLADGSVTISKIAEGSVDNAQLAPLAVTAPKADLTTRWEWSITSGGITHSISPTAAALFAVTVASGASGAGQLTGLAADGVYLLTVVTTSRKAAGARYRSIRRVVVERFGGVVAVLTDETISEDAGLAVTVTAGTDLVDVNLANTSGATLSAHVAVGAMFLSEAPSP